MRETPSSSLCDLLQDTHLYMQSEKTMRQCVVSSLFKVLLFEEIESQLNHSRGKDTEEEVILKLIFIKWAMELQ